MCEGTVKEMWQMSPAASKRSKANGEGENGQAHESSQHCRSELQVWIVSAWLELTELRLRERRGEVLRQFQGTGGARPAASIADERLSTCSVCVGERVDGDSPASVRLPPGPQGSCRQKRNKYQDSGPQVFFSLLFVSLHALSTKSCICQDRFL